MRRTTLPPGRHFPELRSNHAAVPPVVRGVKRRNYIWGAVLAAVALAWLGHRVYLARMNLVTLNVHDAEVRDVIKKCEWQTWETIVVNNDVKGKVTLNVVKVPLEEVLGIIGEQTSSRVAAVYPIFSSSKDFVNLRKLARGEATHETVGWTNFVAGNERFGRGGRGPGGFGGFGGGFGGPPGGPDGMKPQSAPITVHVPGKDLAFATLALSRWSQAQVVPEDGATATVSLQLDQVPFTKAVAAVAKQAGRKWDVFYTLQAQPDFFARFDGEERGDGERGGGERGGRRGFNREERGFNRGSETNAFDTNRWAEFREQREAMRDRETEARQATMTPEEQAKAQEQQQQFEAMRDMTPEQRQQAFEQMRNDPQNQRRWESRRVSYLNNSSPEQRAQRSQRIMDMRARRQQQPRR